MPIHVVRSGDSLYRIARAYGVPMETIQTANEIPNPEQLVVGQTIVIPQATRIYYVRPGDTLFNIGRRFGISPQEIANANRIPLYIPLGVGQRLLIPSPPKPTIEVIGYAEATEGVSENLQNDVNQYARDLTYLAMFSYQVNNDGSLNPPVLGNLLQVARENRVVPMMVVTNIAGGQFDRELGRKIVTDEAFQNRLLNNILQVAREQRYGDIHFDLEFLPEETAESYNQFLRKAAERIHAEGRTISTALAPKTSRTQTGPWYSAHDYRAHGQIVDFVVIMTYEWGYSGGPPLPVSPIQEVRKVVDYAVSEIPANKIFLGQNLYGYDWTLPYRPANPPARAISPQQAIQIAARENVAIQYDYRQQAPFFDYTDNQSRMHKVWFEDARSIQAKFNLIKEYGLRGISYWRLGFPFPQNWLLLRENFTVRKRG